MDGFRNYVLIVVDWNMHVTDLVGRRTAGALDFDRSRAWPVKGISEQRRLTLCYYLKYFQLHAQFPKSLGFVSPQVLEFLAPQIGSANDDGLAFVPKRTDRFYRRQVIAFLNIQRFDKEARAAFLDWLVQTVLPATPKETKLDGAVLSTISEVAFMPRLRRRTASRHLPKCRAVPEQPAPRMCFRP